MEGVAAIAAQVPAEMTDRLVDETGIDAAQPAFAFKIAHGMGAAFGGLLPQERDHWLQARIPRARPRRREGLANTMRLALFLRLNRYVKRK
jgi:hypothetical protein